MNRIALRSVVVVAVTIVGLAVVTLFGGPTASEFNPLYAAPALQEGVGTAFTYQGQLSHNGTTANGEFEFRFQLYDAATAGAVVDGTSAIDETILVENGVFTALLDFGPRAFVGDNVWLGIDVREADVGTLTPLTPRQRLSAAPYATFASQTLWNGLVGLPAGFADNVDNDTVYSAGNGLTLAGGVFSIDTTIAQARVTGTCPAGQSIRTIAQDGAVTCSSGVDLASVQTRIAGTCPAGESIRAIAGDGTVTCEADDIGLTNPVSFLRVDSGENGAINTTNNSDEFITVLIENAGSGNALIARNASSSFPSIFVENTSTKSQIDLGGVFGINASTATEGETGVLGFANDGRESDVNSIFTDNLTGSTGAKFVGAQGMMAASNSNDGGIAVLGIASQDDENTSSIGVYGYASGGRTGTNLAGLFAGDVRITGNAQIDGQVSRASSASKIDHPLDPTNKYLHHSYIESPDMMNVYNGNVVLDGSGNATVQLPAYFEALNRDFRYQLTALGAPGPNLYIAQKIANNQFQIGGGQPGAEVSWQVTGVRQDPYAETHRLQVETDKPANEVGTYLHPESYGQPSSLSKQIAPPQRAAGNMQGGANAASAENTEVASPIDPLDAMRSRSAGQ